MATAITWAQIAITCDLCLKSVQQFCNSCQIGLCRECINKHVNDLSSRPHNIVPFTDRTVQLEYPQCSTHPKQKCEAHCEICDVPACIQCATGPHKGHTVLDISGLIGRKKETIKNETNEIEKFILPKNKTLDILTDNKISLINSRFEDFEKQTKDQRKRWHLEVDNIFDKLNTRMHSLRDHHIAVLNSVKSQLSSQKCSMIQTVQQNKDILSLNRMSLINNYKSKLAEFRKSPYIPDLPQPSLQTNTEDGKHSVTIGRYTAKLTQTLMDDASFLPTMTLPKKSKVVAVIQTHVKKLCRVVCLLSTSAWVSGKGKFISLVGPEPQTVKSTCERFPSDLTINRQGEMVYSDREHRAINIVKDGKTETLITTPTGWHPEGLHCSRSGDILVSIGTTDSSQHKIVRYQGETVAQDIDKDENGFPLFQRGKYALLLSENINEDIVASDQNADVMVVLDRRGKVRFRYNNQPPRGQKPFSPRQVVTNDITGHIIVVDARNSCLHILDQNGQFLRCVDDCGLENPTGLGVDSEGRLWVGFYLTGMVKVIQYLE
ncbi:uncharacterized protein [Magallana gigas]|uniref:uncharacterized protein n=1 Tax=Magallana gigas TaxID=29159 RepID=UPI003342D434